jgi:high affinity sulfate transporter 1
MTTTTAPAAPTGIVKYIPILGWLPKYQSKWLRLDLVAGLTAAAVVIPQAMAYASIAGLPVEVGLYTALTPMVVYALLGTSRPLSVSTTSTLAMLTAAVLAGVAAGGSSEELLVVAVTLAVLVGWLLVLASLLRLGVIANFISAPVLTGFKAGIGVVIFVSQLGKVLGVPVEKGSFIQTIRSLLEGLDGLHWPTLLLGLVTVAILIFLPRLAPRLSAPMVAVVFGIAASALLNLEAQGIKLVGEVPPGLPSFSLPDLSLLQALLPGALGIALMSFTESIASARAFQQHGEPEPDANQELFALGLANIGGGLLQAMPSGGGTSQTAVNDQAGAKSQLAGIATAVMVIITLLFLAPLISLMPQATLGALVLVAAAGLIKVDEFRKIGQVSNRELAWALVAFAGVVLIGTLEGILVAIALSLLNLIYQANHPPVYEVGRKPGTNIYQPMVDHPDYETVPGLLILRTEGMLNFASSTSALEKMQALILERQPQVVLLECSAIPDFEYTALQKLERGEEKLREAGIALWLAGLNPAPLHTIQRSPLGATLGDDRIFSDISLAVEAYLQRFGRNASKVQMHKGGVETEHR